MKKILVLGGGGFIGRNITEFLVKRGDCYVVSADIRKGTNWDILSKDYTSNFCSIIDDFSDPSAFNNLDNDFDEVYMLAAIVGVNRTLKDPFEVIRTNTRLTCNVLGWIEENPIKKLLFFFKRKLCCKH